MEDLERIHTRLDNVKSVEPLLAALRTIAASSWHLARTRLAAARAFDVELKRILQALKPHLPERIWLAPRRAAVETVGMLVIASERGLCGAFNGDVLQGAEQYINEKAQQGYRIEIMTLGARAESYFHRRGRPLAWSEGLPVTTIASFALTQRIHARLVEAYDAGRFGRLDAVYMPYRRGFLTKPVMTQLFPVEPPGLDEEALAWPMPLIDAEPQAIFRQAMAQLSLSRLYQRVVESAASEQSARFRMLDGASDNSQRLIEELTLNFHTARQHAITLEMIDLASGAGLLAKPPKSDQTSV
jgi:F-type H+-transporting ATPase subunit gamma